MKYNERLSISSSVEWTPNEVIKMEVEEGFKVIDFVLEKTNDDPSTQYKYSYDALVEWDTEKGRNIKENIRVLTLEEANEIQFYNMICPNCSSQNFKFTEQNPTKPVCQSCGVVIEDEHIQKVLNAINSEHFKRMNCYQVRHYNVSCYTETFDKAKVILKQGVVDTVGNRQMYLDALKLTESMLPCKVGDFEVSVENITEEAWAEFTSREFDGF